MEHTTQKTGRARRGVSETEVWRAADALLLEGRRPTIESVRRRIGRGSPNTVTPYLDTWFKTLGRRLAKPGTFEDAAGIPESVRDAAAAFWESAAAAVRQGLVVETQEARLELEQREAALAEGQQLLGERTRVADARVAGVDQALAIATTSLTDARKRSEGLERDIEDARREATALRTKVRNLQKELDAARAARKKDRDDFEARFEAQARYWRARVEAERSPGAAKKRGKTSPTPGGTIARRRSAKRRAAA